MQKRRQVIDKALSVFPIGSCSHSAHTTEAAAAMGTPTATVGTAVVAAAVTTPCLNAQNIIDGTPEAATAPANKKTRPTQKKHGAFTTPMDGKCRRRLRRVRKACWLSSVALPPSL
jgi:hypothetical protein